MFPYPVQTMGVTTTRNGVSTREIICKYKAKRDLIGYLLIQCSFFLIL